MFAHAAGEFERAFDTEVAGVRIRAPMMHIHTVAAGGGPLTLTDANVMLGKLNPDIFPAIFDPNQDQKLDGETVAEKFAEIAGTVGEGRSAEAVPRESERKYHRQAGRRVAPSPTPMTSRPPSRTPSCLSMPAKETVRWPTVESLLRTAAIMRSVAVVML